MWLMSWPGYLVPPCGCSLPPCGCSLPPCGCSPPPHGCTPPPCGSPWVQSATPWVQSTTLWVPMGAVRHPVGSVRHPVGAVLQLWIAPYGGGGGLKAPPFEPIRTCRLNLTRKIVFLLTITCMFVHICNFCFVNSLHMLCTISCPTWYFDPLALGSFIPIVYSRCLLVLAMPQLSTLLAACFVPGSQLLTELWVIVTHVNPPPFSKF